MTGLLESEAAKAMLETGEERGWIEPADLEAFALEHELNEDEIEQLSRELEANGLEIGQFGAERVVGRIAIIVGLAAAARVERNDPPGRLGVRGKRNGELVEIGHRARQPRQAHDRQMGRQTRSVAAHVERQAVRRDDRDTGRGVLLR